MRMGIWGAEYPHFSPRMRLKYWMHGALITTYIVRLLLIFICFLFFTLDFITGNEDF